MAPAPAPAPPTSSDHTLVVSPKYAVKIRPWVGYGEIEPVPVEVSSVEELKQAALHLINSMPGSSKDADRRVTMDQLKLYHCKLDENGLPMDVEGRRKILDVGELENPLHGSYGVVWVWVSERTNVASSPQSKPLPEKPCSPFIVREFASVKFGELPEVYTDRALQYFFETWTSEKADQYVQFILAIPGSGKSRTVKAAAEALDIPHCRVKFLHGGLLEPISAAIRSKEQEHTLTYDDWKEILGKPIQSALHHTLKEKGVSKESRAILHVDEIQTLMGSAEVTRESWNGQQDPFSLVMPALCFKLVQVKGVYPNLICVLTGTNFFAKLVVSLGSAVKADYVPLDGTFPVDWVMKLIKKYFKIPEDLMELLHLHVEFLSWNRRAIQQFLVELKTTCVSKTNGDNLSAKDLEACKDAAFSKWTGLISSALGQGKAICVTAMALILFPEAYDGEIQEKELVFPEAKVPQQVRDYCLAGGLNMRVESPTVYIQKPEGCVLGYLSSLTSNVLHRRNLQEVEAFSIVSKSVDTEKGHLFERIVAAELSMLSNGKSPMYAQFKRLWIGDGELIPDPLVFGRAFAYKSTISQDEWKDHQVYCVAELPQAAGRRKVDVGFPILNVIDGKSNPMRVFCELKKGYTAGKLWNSCWKFFTDMETTVTKSNDVIVCFMTTESFLDVTPRTSPTKKSKRAQETVEESEGPGAKESQRLALGRVKSNPRYIILEKAKENTLFPLGAMLEGDDIEHNVEGIDDEVAGCYVGSQM